MKKIMSVLIFSGMVFLASCGGGQPRTEDPDIRDTVMIIEEDTDTIADTIPEAPAPTP